VVTDIVRLTKAPKQFVQSIQRHLRCHNLLLGCARERPVARSRLTFLPFSDDSCQPGIELWFRGGDDCGHGFASPERPHPRDDDVQRAPTFA
jgi:hypothetical protein